MVEKYPQDFKSFHHVSPPRASRFLPCLSPRRVVVELGVVIRVKAPVSEKLMPSVYYRMEPTRPLS